MKYLQSKITLKSGFIRNNKYIKLWLASVYFISADDMIAK